VWEWQRNVGYKCPGCGALAPPGPYPPTGVESLNLTPAEQDRIVPTHDDELKTHFDSGFKRLVDDILRQLRPTHEQLLKGVAESRAEAATLAASVAEMRDTIKSLMRKMEG
jgi:hypothetical protein